MTHKKDAFEIGIDDGVGDAFEEGDFEGEVCVDARPFLWIGDFLGEGIEVLRLMFDRVKELLPSALPLPPPPPGKDRETTIVINVCLVQ